jgi:cytochrome bd-type quinol oxidase subunit 1
MLFKSAPAAVRAFSTTGTIFSICFLEASSGTTPPYGWCVATWDQTTLDKMVCPPEVTAAAVSSQEVSIPRIMLCVLINAILMDFVQYHVHTIVQKNPKYEARNTKQYQITKIRNSKQIDCSLV